MMRAILALGAILLVASACRPPCATDGDCGEGQFCEWPTGECEGTGECVDIHSDIGCYPPADDLRVCGCDGVTYQSDCFRREAAVSKANEGPCE